MKEFLLVLRFLDKHSGLIAAVGLVVAAIGLWLTKRQLALYTEELRTQSKEQQRLSWERVLKLLSQVAHFAAGAHASSVRHSPMAKGIGYLPPDIAAKYDSAQQNLLNYLHQLQIELSILTEETLVRDIAEFIAKYSKDADSRATKQFSDDLHPISIRVAKRAQKSFPITQSDDADGARPA